MMRKQLSIILLLFVGINAFAQVPNYVPVNGLVGYWPFTGNANDVSGNGNNGTVSGAVLTTDRFGVANKAYSFNGTSSKIIVPNSPSLNISTGQSLTISCWIKHNAGTTNVNTYFISKYNGTSSIGPAFAIGTGNSGNAYSWHQIAAGIPNGIEIIGDNTMNDENWHQVVSILDMGNNSRVYIDGVLDSTVNFPLVGSIINTINLHFGCGANLAQYYSGNLDDIGIWNRALTQQEITNLYTETAPVSCLPSYVPTNGLVAYWPFCGNANDESGNGNVGVSTNIQYSQDRFGNPFSSALFDGTSSNIAFPASSNFQPSSYTISAWFKTSVIQYGSLFNPLGQTIVSYSPPNWNQGPAYKAWLWATDNSILGSRQWTPATSWEDINTNPNAINANEWRHCLLIFDEFTNMQKLYIDGVLYGTASSVLEYNNQVNFIIGASKENSAGTICNVFNGNLDDIGFWNRALTQQEITNLYSETLPTPTCSVTASDSTICAGQSITLTSNPTNFASSTPCVSTELPSNLQTGLVGYWPFCGNANDVSGNGNNGTLQGNINYQSDRFGNANSAIKFNNTSDLMCTSNSFSNPNIFTISIWVKSLPNSLGDFLVGFNNGQCSHGGNWDRVLYLGETQFGFFTYNGFNNYLNGNGSYKDGNWHHYVVTLSNSGRKVYIDGQLLIQDNTTTGQNYSGFWRLGGLSPNDVNNSSTSFFDDFIIYNRELSVTEINQLYTLNVNSNIFSWSPGGATTSSISVSPTQTTTYSCTVTNNGVSCTDDVTIVVDTPPTPVITPSGSTSICSGNSVTLTSSSATGNVWSNGATTQAITVSTEGNYNVTVTNASGCSAASANTSVTVNALPTINAGIDQTVCAGTSITLSGSGANTYSWNNGVTNAVAFTPASTATYTVTGTNTTTGCTNTDQVVVTVNALPTVNAGIDQTVCAGTSVTLSGSGANTYSWNNGVNNAVSFTPASTATYTLTGTNTATGCTNTDQVVVTVNALPTVNAGIDQTVCAGTSITLSGTGANTYSWNNGVTNAVAFTPASTTTYTLTGTNTTTGCTNTDQVVVTVNALPTVNAGVDQTVCTGTSVTLSGSGANTYSWNNGVSNGIGFTPASTITYTVTGTNTSTGCTNTDQVVVTVNALPTVNAGIDQTVCAGTSITLSGSGANTYSWNNGVSNGIGFTPASTITYTVTGTNTSTGCTNTDQVVVTVNALPTVNAGIDQTVCAGTSITLSGSGANTYSWNNGVTNAVTFTPASTITYTVIGTNTTTGCTNTDQVVVTVNALPTVNAGIDQTVCAGTSVSLSGSGANTYSWNNSVTNAVAFTPALTATYTVTGTNTATGCTNTDQVVVTVNTLPTVNAGNDQAVCAGTSVTLSGSGANTYSWNNGVTNGVAFTPASTATYTLTGTNTSTGCTNTDQVVVTVNALPTVNAGIDQTVCVGTSVTLSGSGANTYSWNNGVTNAVAFTPVSTATYTLTGTNTTTGCTNTDQVVVTVNALPLVNGGADQSLCQGQSTTLFATGANSFSWSNNIVNGVGFLPTLSQEYIVTGTNTLTGCINSDTVSVTVNALPIVNAGADLTICKGDTILLSGSGALNYSWNNNVVNGQEFVPAVTQTYQVVGTDANNCSNNDEITVTVNEASASTLTETALDSYTLNGQTYTQSGTYTQVIPNAAGCDSTITLNLSLDFTGINETQTGFTIAPNPTMDFVTITSTDALYDNYGLFDPQGRKVLSGTLTGTTTQLDLSRLSRGNYLLQIGEKKTPFKLIKQ